MKIDKVRNYGTHAVVTYRDGSQRIIRPRNPRYMRVSIRDTMRTTEIIAIATERNGNVLIATRVDGSKTEFAVTDSATVTTTLFVEDT